MINLTESGVNLEFGEITHLVQTVDGLEAKAGVRIEALYAFYDAEFATGPHIAIRFDAVSDDPLIADRIEFLAPVYNEKGQLIETGRATIFREDFLGHDPVEIMIWSLTDEPKQIRLYPKLET